MFKCILHMVFVDVFKLLYCSRTTCPPVHEFKYNCSLSQRLCGATMDSTLLSSIMCKNKSEHSNPSMQHYENITGTSCVKFKHNGKTPVHLCWFNFSRVKESRSRNSMKIQVDSGYTIIQKCFCCSKKRF